MGCDHKGSSSGRIGEKLSLDNEERRVTGGESDDAEEIGVDLMLVLVQHSVGGAEAGATRGRRSSGWSISCHWTAKASTEAPDLEIRTRRSRQT
ncbi:hypothetical protein BHE74_00029671 [Ensete ventricosum]|nr:hypothetical protein BHE74_00029671 [Ensete ventricosum]